MIAWNIGPILGFTLGPEYPKPNAPSSAFRNAQPVFEHPKQTWPCKHPVFNDEDAYPYWHRVCSHCGAVIDII